MSVHCNICGSSDLRKSRFRWKDIIPLIVLYYPMRCWVCRSRNYLPLLRILRSGRFGQRRRVGPVSVSKAQIE